MTRAKLGHPARRRKADAALAFDADPVVLLAQGLVMLKLALLLLVFDPRALDVFELTKSTLSHAASLPIAASLLWLSLRYGLGFWRFSWLHVAVLIYLTVAGIATLFALNQTAALFGADRRFLGLTELLDGALLFLACSVLFRTGLALRRLVLGISAALLIVLGYAFLQRVGLDPIGWKDVDPRVHSFSTTGQPNLLGGLLGIALATALSLLVLRWTMHSAAWRLALAAFCALLLAGALVAGARNALLGVGAGVAVALALYRPRPAWARPRVLLGLGAGVVALGVLLLATVARGEVERQLSSGSIQERLFIWETSLRILAAHPLLGVGPDNLLSAYAAYRPEHAAVSGTSISSSAHSWIFHVAVGSGLLGLAAYLGVLLAATSLVVGLARRGSAAAIAAVPLAAYLGQGLVNIGSVSLEWVFWASLGVLAGNTGAAAQALTLPKANQVRRAWELAAGVALVAVALYASTTLLPRITASEEVGLSDALVNQGRALDAVPHSTRAVGIDPRRAEYWSQLGTALISAGSASAAANAYERATQVDPTQATYWRNLALMRLQAGTTDARSDPAAALRRALAADQYDMTSLDLIAKLSYNARRFEEAADYGERLARLNPPDVASYEAPIRAYLQLQRWDDAVRLTRRALEDFDTPHLHVLLAVALDARGDKRDALAQIEQARALSPDDPEVKAVRDQLVGTAP